MEFESILTLIIVALIAFGGSFIITFIMRKIHITLVFVLPVLLTLLTINFATFIFSDDAGLGVIFLVGFMVIAGIAAGISWLVALYAFFKHKKTKKPSP